VNFNFALEYTIRKVQTNQQGLKLIGTKQLLFALMMLTYWGENVHNIKKNRGLVASLLV